MPLNIRSFDVIVGMDWLSPHHVDIMCHEKVIRLHLPNHENLIIYGDKPNVNFRIFSCIKAQKCLHKSNYTFLAHNMDKSTEEINIRDIPVACDFPDVFLEDLLGIPRIGRSNFGLTLYQELL